MNRCETTTELFSDYFDGGLSPAERKGLEEHLRECGSCRAEFEHYTRSLKALHDTAPLETTQVFLTNVRAAAQHELERRELFLRTGMETPGPGGRPAAPGWVPWALAGVTVLAFGAGYVSSLRRPDPALRERLARLERQLAEKEVLPPAPEKPPPPAPVDETAVLKRHGLVKAGDAWIPETMRRDFQEGRVYLGPGRALAPEEAAKELARHFPPPEKPPPPAAGPTDDEILEKHGLVRIEGTAVPRVWIERWAAGEILVGVNEWRKPSAFKEALIREHDLVEKNGRLLSRAWAEEIADRQLVHKPEATAADNAVTAALEGLRIGAPLSYRGLTLYPLIAPAPAPEAAFMTLHAALGTGKLEITDREFFSVQVRNPLEADVFFLAGEILAGGRCARMVARDTLVPARRTGAVPVLCVEPGAWRPKERFDDKSGHYVAPPALRRAIVAEHGQGVVWSILSRGLEKGRGGQLDLFSRHRDTLIDSRAFFSDLPDREEGVVGVAVALGDAVEMAEFFRSPALFRAYADRLAGGAALEVLERPAGTARRPAPAHPNSIRGVKQFLEDAFSCAFEARADGFDLRRESARVGRACATAEGLHHAVLFSPGAVEWERRAAYAVPGAKLERILAEYEERFKSAGALLKAAVLRDMASINAPPVVPVLLGHLGEPDLAVRRTVVRELGACEDPAAVKELVALLDRSRKEKEITIFAEAARALARIGDERAIEPLLRQMDQGNPDAARLVVLALPELLLQARSREPLERAVGRLIDLYVAAEAAARGEIVGDPMTRGYGRPEAQAVSEAARGALRQVTGLDHDRPALYRAWWNDRANRDRFLRERTGK